MASITEKDTQKSTNYNLKQEKGADLQEEQGAALTSKNRLREKSGIDETVENLPMYGTAIKNLKKYYKHSAKVKEYSQPYVSPLADEPELQDKTEQPKTEGDFANEADTAESLAVPEDRPTGKIQKDINHKKQYAEEHGLKTKPPRYINTEKSTKSVTLQHKSQDKTESDFANEADTAESLTVPEDRPTGKTQKDINHKKQYAEEHGLKTKPPKEKGADLQEEQGADLTSKNRLTEKSGIDETVESLPMYGTGIKNRKKYYKHTAKVKEYAQPYVSPPADEPEFQDKIEQPKTESDFANETDTTESPTVPEDSPTIKTQKDINHKKQYAEEHGLKTKPPRYINTAKSTKSVTHQHKLHDKADKLTKKGSKLREQQIQAIEAMPAKNATTSEHVYDVVAEKPTKSKTTEKRTLQQNETRWNNPKFTDKLKTSEGAEEKTKVIVEAVDRKGEVIGVEGAVGTVVDVGDTPAVAGALVAKSTIEYGSKLIQNTTHRQIREDISKNGDNEVLKAAHWAEQQGEHALGKGIKRLNPMSIRRYVKNAPYRHESKLKIKELKNDKQLGLLRVKQDKATDVNHMTGKKSSPITRAWQKRQIKRNYQKAMIAVTGKDGGSIGVIARELARGNPKAILAVVAKNVAIVTAKFVVQITVLNVMFWKLMAIVFMFVLILLSVQACVAILSPSLAGIGFVSDEDISFSTRAYSEWEVDMQMFLNEVNILEEFPPPPHITGQPGAIGEVVYPLYPYTSPPPFYEYRFEVGMISHDPMELISYLTARHGERFDEEFDNPMTRSDLEAVLREIFQEQYGIAPGDFDNLIREEIETRFRRERRLVSEIRYDAFGELYFHEEIIYADVYYQFWILTVSLKPRSLSDVLRSRMTEDEEMHFDVLNLTGNGRQVIGNPFDFNWLPFITSHYGYRVHPITNVKQLHLGIDIGLPLGTPIFATHDGKITQVQFSNTGYGNMIRLRGEGADEIIYETLFAHLHDIQVTEGQQVSHGDLIATVGTSGDSTGPHLHLEVFRPSQIANINGTNTILPAMHINPLFAVITWTDEESNEAFRPAPDIPH